MLRKYPEHPQNSEVRQVLIKIDKDMRRELRRGDGLTGLIVQSLGYVALGSGFHIPAHAIRVEEEPDTPAE